MYLLDKKQRVRRWLKDNDFIEAEMTEEINAANQINFSTPLKDRIADNIYYVAIPTPRSKQKYLLFKLLSERVQNDRIEYQGIEEAYDELKQYGYIKDIRPNDRTAEEMLKMVLEPTRWTLGNVTETSHQSTNLYYITYLEALQKIVGLFNIELTFEVTIDPKSNKITRRQVNIYTEQGQRTGKRFEYGSNLLTVQQEQDSQELITALVGRGKGELVSEGHDDTPDGYGRRITFADVVWTKKDGNPVDKPAGQEYLIDPEATALYGFSDGNPRIGLTVFEDIEDPVELINATWRALQSLKRPKVSFKADVTDVGQLGLGDTVAIIRHDLKIEYLTRVYKVKHNLLNENDNQIELGDDFSGHSITSSLIKVDEIANEARETAGYAAIAANGKNNNYYSSVQPLAPVEGDIWYKDLGNGETDMYQYHNGGWVFIQSTRDLHVVENQVKEAQQGLDQAKADIINNKQKADADIENLNKSIEANKKTADESLQKLNDSVANLQGQYDNNIVPNLNQVTADVADALQKYTTAQQNIADLTKQAQEQGKDIADVSNTVKGLNINYANLAGDVNSTKVDVKGLQTTIGTANGDIAQLKLDAQNLQTMLAGKVDNTTYTNFVNLTNQALNARLTASDLNGYAKTVDVQATANGLRVDLNSVTQDIQNDLSQLSARIATTSQQFSSYYTKSETDNKTNSAKNDAVNAIKSDGNWQGLSNILTNSGFLQTADGFLQKVQQTTIPMFNGGGVNLLKGTADFRPDNLWQPLNAWVRTNETYNGLTIFKGKTTEDWNGLCQYYPVKSGETYTFSLNARYESGTGKSFLYIQLNSSQEGQYKGTDTTPRSLGINLNENWQRYSFTFKASSDGYIKPRIERGDKNKNILEICGFKLEQGSVATPWTPNPADLATQSAFSELSQSLEGLRSTVGSNYGSLQSQISQSSSSIRTELTDKINGVDNKTTSTANSLNSVIGRVGSLENLTNFQVINNAINANDYTKTGNYFIQSTSNTNVPATNWCYLKVEKVNDGRIVQTWQADNDPTLRYVRTKFGDSWTQWQRSASYSEYSELNRTVQGLQSTVSSNHSDLQSQISQTAKTIRQEVSDKTSGLQTQINQQANSFNVSLNALRNETAWQKVTTAIDANNYTTTGNYWIQAVSNSNTPDGSAWAYLEVVAEPAAERIKQTWQRDNNANEAYTRLKTGNTWSDWQKTVTAGNIMAQINMSAGTTLIQNNKIYMDADSTIFSGKAFIPSAAISNLSADKITTGTLNAGLINVINLNASSITTGTINGANLKIDLNNGEVQFKRGRITSIANTLNINIDTGTMSVTDGVNNGVYFANGELKLMDDPLNITGTPKYGGLRRSAHIWSPGSAGAELHSPNGVFVGSDNYNGAFAGGSGIDGTSSGAALAVDKDGSATLNGANIVSVSGGRAYDIGYSMKNRSAIILGKSPSGWNPGDRTFIQGSYVHIESAYRNTSGASPNVCVAQDGALVRSTSASKYKTDIQRSYVSDYGERLLELPTATWMDKAETERYVDGESQDKPVRHFGMIAEDLADAGLEMLVSRGQDGELEGIQYDRIGPALIPVIKQLQDKVNKLEEKLNER
ncbi:phage tail protein [Limosilactobacillus fermentum]|uniref:phage tail spike protein n=1 Tax=Limosilactobacillus fermentum TaxID=1613 RepID=UPI00187F409A|nr:phage tail spike protein [Limosilactobacillus fermentum]MBE8117838.1 phage tail protein [Limosilactobacillus fermentum]